MIDFPNSPTTGQVFTPAGGPTYVWTGVGWAIQGAGGTVRVIPGGRLTLASGTPVLSANTVGAGTVYYTPYIHDGIPIYNGTSWAIQVFIEQNVVLDATNFLSGNNYDFFMFLNAGVPTLGYGPAWTSNTARSAAISRQNGYWTNTASITLRTSSTTTFSVAAGQALYVGTIRATANGQTTMNFNPAAASGGSPNTVLAVFNTYNRVQHVTVSRDSAASWTGTTTWRRAHANANNSCSFMDGLGEVSSIGDYLVGFSSPGNLLVAVGISFNATTAPTAQAMGGSTGAAISGTAHAASIFPPAMGFNALNAMEVSDTTNTWYGSGVGTPVGQSQAMSLWAVI